MPVSVTETPERLAFYDKINESHLSPLWVGLGDIITPEPVSPLDAHVFRYQYRLARLRTTRRNGERGRRAEKR